MLLPFLKLTFFVLSFYGAKLAFDKFLSKPVFLEVMSTLMMPPTLFGELRISLGFLLSASRRSSRLKGVISFIVGTLSRYVIESFEDGLWRWFSTIKGETRVIGDKIFAT